MYLKLETKTGKLNNLGFKEQGKQKRTMNIKGLKKGTIQ